MNGEAGLDRRGFWINDRLTGTQARIGDVSYAMAYTLAEQGNHHAARQALTRPHVGFWFNKKF